MKNNLPQRPIKLFDPNRFTPDEKKISPSKPKYNLRAETAKKKTPTGEGVVFEKIWKERPHRSFVSRTYLGDDARSWFFAHVIPKGKYPDFRLEEKNIVLLTKEEHFIYDNMPRSEIEKLPKWKPLLNLEKELLEEYKKLTPKTQPNNE